MPTAVIVDAVRTARGKRKGSLATTHPLDLAAHVLKAAVRRTKIEPKVIDDVVLGCVTQVGEQGMNIARGAVLDAGLPIEIAGSTVNRFCGSGLQAVNFAAQAIMSGAMDLAIGGGVEGMTRVPMGSDAMGGEGPMSHQMMERWPNLVPQGLSAEMIAEKWKIDRKEVDEFSVQSQQKAGAAIKEGKFKAEIEPIEVTGADGQKKSFDTDEHCRPGTNGGGAGGAEAGVQGGRRHPRRQLERDRRRCEEVRADLVHLVHERHARDVVLVGLTPDGLALRLDAVASVENRDGAVEHPKGALDLDREVDVAGSVDDVDAVGDPRRRTVEGTPEAVRRRRSDRDAALLLLDHVVHGRGALVDLADLVVDARVVEDAFRSRSLPRIDMRHDADVACPLQRIFASHRNLLSLTSNARNPLWPSSPAFWVSAAARQRRAFTSSTCGKSREGVGARVS